MTNKIQQLHINLDNICQLNHFIYTHSLKTNMVGKEYSSLCFHGGEENSLADPWEYKINKYGYRGNNWSMNTNAIAFFGCSVTFGIGVEKDIATAIQEILNIECYNIGQPGSSAINILKAFIHFISHCPVKTVVITLPPLTRVFHPTYDTIKNVWHYGSLLPHWVNPHDPEIHKYAFLFFTDDTSLAYLYDYIKMAEIAASISKTKIIWSSWDEYTRDALNTLFNDQHTVPVGNMNLDKARDGIHPGPTFVQMWSTNLIQELKKYF